MGHRWEAFQSIKEAPLKECPSCNKPKAKREVSAGSGFILKGGGWYSDLYGSSKGGKKSEAKSGESKSGESKSGESKSGEAKSGESKSGESKSGESKSGESKSDKSKSGESKSGESTTKTDGGTKTKTGGAKASSD